MRLLFNVLVFATALFAGHAVAQQVSLKNTLQNKFFIGAAINPSWVAADSTRGALVKSQFNSISPESVLKWQPTEPQEGKFNFGAADEYVDFGTRNHMFVVGHTLVWHAQTPDWVFKGGNGNPADRETLLKRMRNHIHAVMGRYKGRIKSWDVVNEALNDDGSLRDSPWRKIIGDDYIDKAFQYAHEADPNAELFYNDYGIEIGPKRAGAVALLRRLKASGVPITGVGIQEHIGLTWPSAQIIDAAITAFGNLGLKVAITELDVNVLPQRSNSLNADVGSSEAVDPSLNPYTAGLPQEVQQQLANRYAELFGIYLRHCDSIERITLWGVADGVSWLNNWPINGRTNYPLLFDRSLQPKPAYYALLNEVKAFSGRCAAAY
ncbi:MULTISPECIES: endo-1,4-beta-xylanase [Burkholderia cepacia complex]|uniref:endo-1,4-beta-xylanase n=1 Tax=Burkholderia cepacia complex TaxID=87882 RepID=UPI00157B35E2|nr:MULTISPECIES: endo-1,4-beta-xylanase [Burkholderia cepacia complex]NTY41619.1 endo-1,4-beta-xylanase [Burkholderia diffusa]